MKSRALVMGHPAHPILIVFPIAFLYGCAVSDLIARLADSERWWTVGAYLSVAGVVMGLVAAVPGVIDYFAVVPPDSSAKKRATYHMAVNVTGIALVAIGFAFRDWDSLMPGWATVILELAAVGLITWGGWMGGTLVYRNQIAVDHRYANSGKWKEHSAEGAPGETVAIEGAEEMEPGQMRLVHWKTSDGERRLVVARTEEGFAAFDDRCTHKGGPLSDGALICGTVQCPWHGSQFDCRTGEVKAGPAKERIATYKAELRDGKVHVTLQT